jgi:hypothetical protein
MIEYIMVIPGMLSTKAIVKSPGIHSSYSKIKASKMVYHPPPTTHIPPQASQANQNVFIGVLPALPKIVEMNKMD